MKLSIAEKFLESNDSEKTRWLCRANILRVKNCAYFIFEDDSIVRFCPSTGETSLWSLGE